MITALAIFGFFSLVYFISSWAGKRAAKAELEKVKPTQYEPVHFSGTEAGDKWLTAEPEPDNTPYRRELTKAEKLFNQKLMDEHIEQFPDSKMHKDDPTFLDGYLSRIDIDLPPGIHTEE